jgi:hypothetical protein
MTQLFQNYRDSSAYLRVAIEFSGTVNCPELKLSRIMVKFQFNFSLAYSSPDNLSTKDGYVIENDGRQGNFLSQFLVSYDPVTEFPTNSAVQYSNLYTEQYIKYKKEKFGKNANFGRKIHCLYFKIHEINKSICNYETPC